MAEIESLDAFVLILFVCGQCKHSCKIATTKKHIMAVRRVVKALQGTFNIDLKQKKAKHSDLRTRNQVT